MTVQGLEFRDWAVFFFFGGGGGAWVELLAFLGSVW